MSYILDALKRSERERIARGVTNLNSITAEQVVRRRFSYPYLILCGLFVLMAIILGWVFLRVTAPPASISSNEQCVSPPSILPGNDLSKNNLPIPQNPSGDTSPSAAIKEDEITAQASSPTNLNAHQPIENDATRLGQSPMPTQEMSGEALRNMQDIYESEDEEDGTKGLVHPAAKASGSGAGQNAEIPYFNDLPAEIKMGIPPFRISLYAYSDIPDERFIVSNGKKVRVGEEVSEGLKLLYIGPSALMVQSGNTKFAVPR